MAVEKVGEDYRCNICGNEVTVTKVGGGTLVCCGKDMEKVGSEEDTWTAQHLPDAGVKLVSNSWITFFSE